MDKTTATNYIKAIANNKVLTRDEVGQAYDQGAAMQAGSIEAGHKKNNLGGALYFIGACIVLIGIVVLISTHWDSLSSSLRVLATLGFAVAFYVAGALLIGQPKTETVARVAHVIAAGLLPLGVFVSIYEYGVTNPTLGLITAVVGCLTVLYAITLYVWRHSLFTLLLTVYATWFTYVLVTYLVDLAGIYSGASDIYEYVTLALGACYVLVGNSFTTSVGYRRLSNLYYSVGSIAVYSAVMILSDWKPNQSVFYEILYPILVAVGVYLSVRWTARGLFMVSTIALFAYIAKITSEYFSDALGWPFALIIAGVIMIGAGYLLVNIRSKIKNQADNVTQS